MDRNRIGKYLLILLAAVFPTGLAAQNSVTPIIMPTPAGNLITVNNGAGNHSDPHVSGDLVSYSSSDANGNNSTVRYFNLATGVDAAIPNDGTALDFLADVRGSTIAFTRISVATGEEAIFTFDTSNPGNLPVETDAAPGTTREEAQIGDQTIAWMDFGIYANFSTTAIVAFDRSSMKTQNLTPYMDGIINQLPGISPDGTIIVWSQCLTPAICPTWEATLSNGTWTAQQLVSQVGGSQSHADTDGTTITYSSRFLVNGVPKYAVLWQPVGGGPENLLNLGGGALTPSISGGLIAFAYAPPGTFVHDLEIYNPATNVLYDLTKDVTPGDTTDKQVNDISITPDGKVRIVWQEVVADTPGASFQVYAYTFNLPVGDFNFGPISPMTISAGGSGSTSVTVEPLNGFDSAVSLTATGQPAGVSVSLAPNSVTPSGGTAASSVLNVNLPPFLVPTNFTLTVTGTSGTLSHSTGAEVIVTATTSSIGNLVGDLLGAGCIDNGGIANALTSKLSAAQAAISAGNVQTAINTLTALKNQINAQAGKHIATSCAIGGVTFNPVTVLLADVQSLIDGLRVRGIADPITGYVTDSNGVGVFGATVSILDAGGNPVASSATDITGYYFFATTGMLVPGSSYTVAATSLPAGFATATPAASPAFTWSGTGMMVGNFVLN
jgi:hypothetical protein